MKPQVILILLWLIVATACLQHEGAPAPKPAPIPPANTNATSSNITSAVYMAHYLHVTEAGTVELADVTNLVAELARGGAICAQYGHGKTPRGGRCPICGQQP